MAPPKFIRVVERDGWRVELVGSSKTQAFATREEAVGYAIRNQPGWIEVGETTLRRRSDGSYESMEGTWHGED